MTFFSCHNKQKNYNQNPVTEYAKQWTQNIKQKIIEDANQQEDKVVYDTTRRLEVTLYKADKKLKTYLFTPSRDTKGKLTLTDTIVTFFYSTDQNFKLVKEHCPNSSRIFEGITYNDNHLGVFELKYCDGKTKEIGYRFNGNVGVWLEFDRNNNVIKDTDYGNIESLEELKNIKYYR
jgi:hypothetical protein